MIQPVFSLQNVEYLYPGERKALSDINLEILPGESVVLLGANACGKSTLLHLMDGLYFPSSGQINAFGNLLTEAVLDRGTFAVEFRKRVGYLFQNPDAQLFCSSVEEELAFGPHQLGLPIEEIQKRVDELAQWCEIEHLLKRAPHHLSGGEKKRVALASILTTNPSVLLLDEPTASMDPRTEGWLTEVLQTLHVSGKTLVIATHDLHFAMDVAERAVVLSEEHRIVQTGPVDQIITNRELLMSVNLIRAHTHRKGLIEHGHLL